GGRPCDLQARLDDLLGQCLHAAGTGEEGLVLKIDVIEVVAVPELLQSQCHACGFKSNPLAAVNERIGAESAAEIAALRGNVVELPLALELEIALDRD